MISIQPIGARQIDGCIAALQRDQGTCAQFPLEDGKEMVASVKAETNVLPRLTVGGRSNGSIANNTFGMSRFSLFQRPAMLRCSLKMDRD